MREIEAKQSKKPISKRDNRAVTLLSLSASPTAPAQPKPEAGFYLPIEDATEFAFFPNIARLAEIWQSLTPNEVNDTTTTDGQQHDKKAYVGTIFLDTKRRSSVLVVNNSPMTYQIHRSPYGTSMRLNAKFVKTVSTFRLPKRFRRIFKLLSEQLKPHCLKLVQPRPLRKVTAMQQKRIRSPTKRQRKAKDTSAEGDPETHTDFWLATVKPRAVRAPTPPLPPAER